ncbi:Hypothetical predicted protein [Mytilus galloprovincialis]|uniref:Fibrinogen C-terminal domain-containing protein n=1 Tax=Mytilus galloprovincialis TaxID=29158 RepID=A0A8B6EA69_MYTGA|nr:Hypothetical predicted protein [Mytilus galloprovincialis]
MHKLTVRRPKDCSDLEPNRDTSGVYTIYPTRGRGVKVYCDMKTDGGRWTVLVRRMDGSQDFNKKWIEYENGFGNLDKEFWLGNRYLHTLTSIGKTEMRVDMQNFKGDRKFAKYTTFKVGDALSKYKLTIGGFTGNVPDAFAAGNHNGQRFTTSDNDNDKDSTNCSTQLKRDGGGCWFNRCEMALLQEVILPNLGFSRLFICLPSDPNYRKTTYRSEYAPIYGGEYDNDFFVPNANGNDIPCSVCRTNGASTVLMIPGAHDYTFAAATSHICMHIHPEFVTGGSRNDNGKLVHPVVGECGALECPPY